MIFTKCTRLFGEANIFVDSPEVRTYRDVILDHWTLYDRSRRVIPHSAYYRGVPSYDMAYGNKTTSVKITPAYICMPDRKYFWLGPFHVHFGHFLVSTLARLWALPLYTRSDFLIAYVGGMSPKELFAIGFIRDCLEAMGIREDHLVQVSSPAYFPQIVVAEPAFVENHSAYSIYFSILRKISSEILGGGYIGNKQSSPVYISKQKIVSGVRTIINENELTQILLNRGMEVVFPDTLSFREQLAFWSNSHIVFGFASSGFHTSAFFSGKRLCTITHDPSAWSNQILLDLGAGNENLHINCQEVLDIRGKTEQFAESMVITHPVQLAADIIRLAENYGCLNTIRPQRLPPEPRTLNQTVLVDDPFGINLALLGTASQSSTYPIDEGRTRDASGAISGHLTGGYQCHTACELGPWWQVELLELSILHEVRIFNRCDNPVAQVRLDRLRILLSVDGSQWRIVDERGESQSIGGLLGQPYRWLAPPRTNARFIRIQINEMTFLHLDQVEVFGDVDEAIWSENIPNLKSAGTI